MGRGYNDHVFVDGMSIEMLTQRISDVDDALSSLPLWYHKNISTQSTVKYGGVLISELENIRIILVNH